MPFDGNPEADQQDVLEGWRCALMMAADYIKRHGWCQRVEMNPGGHVCLVGAMNVTMERDRQRSLHFPRNDWEEAWQRLGRAAHSASRHVAAYDDSARGRYIVNYNDYPGRTKEEVINLLRECARS